MSSTATLVARHTDATYRLIIDTAVALLERTSPSELTIRAVARQAGMSERTIFRYYRSREEFLDAVALAVYSRLETPEPPANLEDLCGYPRELYVRFEEKAGLVKATLHNEIAVRIREGVGQRRWRAVREIIDARAPHCSERERRIAAANVQHYLSASAWHYYRFYLGLTLEDTIEAAETAVRLAIGEVLPKPASARRASGRPR